MAGMRVPYVEVGVPRIGVWSHVAIFVRSVQLRLKISQSQSVTLHIAAGIDEQVGFTVKNALFATRGLGDIYAAKPGNFRNR